MESWSPLEKVEQLLVEIDEEETKLQKQIEKLVSLKRQLLESKRKHVQDLLVTVLHETEAIHQLKKPKAEAKQYQDQYGYRLEHSYQGSGSYVSLKSVQGAFHEGKLEDWFTIGVVTGLQNSEHFCCGILTDLKETPIAFIAEGEARSQLLDIGIKSVVVIKTPDVLVSKTDKKTIAFQLKQGHVISLGSSPDAGFCQHNLCPILVDTRTTRHCTEHLKSLYKTSKLKRQELAGGNAPFRLGEKSNLKSVQFPLPNNFNLSCFGFKLNIRGPPKPQVLSVQQLQLLTSNSTPGAKCLRALQGIPEPIKQSKQVFGASALVKMGQVPKQEFVELELE